MAGALEQGIAVIKEFAGTLTTRPGVYRMIASDGAVLYVGKAKNLKTRVTSYTQAGRLNRRLASMVSQTAEMAFVVTASEGEALLLEANLIKSLKPKYNILLRDDKSYPYLAIDVRHAYPRITKYRGAKRKGHIYYGPFASAGAVNESLQLLQKAFLLRPCSDTYMKNRTRPCLQYQIKRCSAPCMEYVSQADYGALLTQAKAFLEGDREGIAATLEAQMAEASEATDYELAAQMRDRLQAIAKVQADQRLAVKGVKDADVIGVTTREGKACVVCMRYRAGQAMGHHHHILSVGDNEMATIMGSFIGQYYQTHPCPPLLLLSHSPDEEELLAEALSQLAKQQVQLLLPQRGDKKNLVKWVVNNAEQSLAHHVSEAAHMKSLLDGLREHFELEKVPERIEIYDNSHIQGTHAVGCMVVAGAEGFQKNAYRRYNMPTDIVTGGDDYAMMREMLMRRLKHVAGDKTHKDAVMPDLLLIDGGKGQLSAVYGVLDSLGLTIPVVGIAKGEDRNAGREWFFLPNGKHFQLPDNDPLLHYIQRLRDEAHRFAIGSHRKKRSKAIGVSLLDDISGIGAARKKALLAHFGSAKLVAGATLEDLLHVPGIHRSTAERVYSYFNGSE